MSWVTVMPVTVVEGTILISRWTSMFLHRRSTQIDEGW